MLPWLSQTLRNCIFLVCLLAGMYPTAEASAAGQDWEKLLPDQKELLERLAADEFCSCDGSLTLLGCWQKKPQCGLSNRIQDIMIHGLQAGVGKTFLASFLSQEVVGPFCSKPIGLEANFHVEKAPSKTGKQPEMVVIEFSDFHCSHCQQALPQVEAMLKRYGDKLRFVSIPIALTNMESSLLAAEAALAAHSQGKFWPMSQALFAANGSDFTIERLLTIAKAQKLDSKKFAQMLKTHVFRATIQTWRDYAIAHLALKGTPMFYIQGRPYLPSSEWYSLSDRIALELERNSAACKS